MSRWVVSRVGYLFGGLVVSGSVGLSVGRGIGWTSVGQSVCRLVVLYAS